MLWVLTNTLFMFCLQSKLSKLSQAPKLEPLNEGGGAALLQVVSVQWNISSTVFTLLAAIQLRHRTERLISVNSPDFFFLHVSFNPNVLSCHALHFVLDKNGNLAL